MSNRKNLANAILALGVSTSDTTWILEAGYGDEMPDVPFELTATPFGQLSTMGNSEIILVTAISTDTLTVERAQKGTTAKAFLAGAVVSNGISTDDVVGTMVNVTTANNTAAKVGTTDNGNFMPVLGDKIIVNFVNGSNVSNPTLNIDGSGAKNIRLGQTNATTATMGLGTGANSNIKIAMWYDGTYWKLYGANDNTNTTYTEITEAEIDAGTASTLMTITGRRAEYIKRRGGQVGDIFMSLRTTPGINRLFMDGSTYNKADFPLLWALQATHPAYFTASDTLTFTLADMRERMPFGKSETSPFTTLGYKMGTQEETLTVNQIPSHGHPNRWRAFMPSGTGSFVVNDRGGDAVAIPDNATHGGNGENITGNPSVVTNTGGGLAHNNMPPIIVMNYEVVAA